MEKIEEIIASFHIDPSLLYDAIVSSTDDYIYIVDMKKDLALVSENMARDFELPGRLVPGLVPLWGASVHERDRGRYFQSIQEMMDGETDEHNVEYQIRNRKGEYIWVVCRGRLKRDGVGEPIMFAGVVTSLGDKGKVDHTTGLFTQRECEKRVTRLAEQHGGRAPGGLLLLGLDDFTRVNDLNDHIFGDTVLRQFAQSVQGHLPDGAEVFRFDGDEFAILWDRAEERDLLELYRKLHFYSNRRHEVDGVSYYCTVSGGIAMLGRDGDNYLDLIKYAASALEASKRRGKNICTVFSPGLIEARLRSMEIANQLQMSVAGGMERFRMVYQPLSQAGDLSVHGAEALLRWSCPLGEISPGEFIPVLESTSLIQSVGRWVLEQAVRTCRAWTAFCPDFVMNINISYLQMLEKDFVPQVRELLRRYALEPRHVVLELTESYFVTDMEMLKDTFRALREMGVRLAMDDFGTGYSSRGLLAASPADEVKIDRAFISAIHDNAFNRSFIGAVVQLCHSVGISVCVEGVERYEELKTVRTLQADSIQGFYLARPMPEEAFRARYWEGAGEKN